MRLYYLFTKARRSQQTDLQSLFYVKLSDKSKVVIDLHYHDRSTIQRNKLNNTECNLEFRSSVQNLQKSAPFVKFYPEIH